MIETLVALSIFMIAVGAMFVLFERSYQSFHFLEQRQSVQSQVLRISSALEADFRLTHLVSVGVEPRSIAVDGATVRRDLTSCLIVDDWRDPANFRPDTGIPKWNRYAVYLTDLADNGKLERVTYEPPSTGASSSDSLPVVPLSGMSGLDQDGVLGRQILCENLLAWRCERDTSGRHVVQTLRLLRSGAKRGLDANKTSESFEARFRWNPKNTVPRL